MQEKILKLIELMDYNSIRNDRKDVLKDLAIAVKNRLDNETEVNVTFICTHNSRRSQMAQVWAVIAAQQYRIKINAFSGGTEVTTTAPQVLDTFEYFGFEVNRSETSNGKHKVNFGNNGQNIKLHSKLYHDSSNPKRNFIAVMTCSDADENCPIVVGCSKRVALTYNDPKRFDGSILEKTMYQNEAFRIGTEIMFAFSYLSSL